MFKMKEEDKIPSLREILDFLNSKTIKLTILAIALIIIIVSGLKLADVYGCKEKDGLWMEDGKCYVPKDEAERKLILEQGFVKTGFDWEKDLNDLLVDFNETTIGVEE